MLPWLCLDVPLAVQEPNQGPVSLPIDGLRNGEALAGLLKDGGVTDGALWTGEGSPVHGEKPAVAVSALGEDRVRCRRLSDLVIGDHSASDGSEPALVRVDDVADPDSGALQLVPLFAVRAPHPDDAVLEHPPAGSGAVLLVGVEHNNGRILHLGHPSSR